MKVFHLVKTSIGATWAMREMRELVKLGIEVHVALPLNGPLINKYKKDGIIVHELNYSLKSLIKCCRNLRNLIYEINPDIIQSHFVLTTIIMRLALRNDKRPRIFQVPGPLHLENFLFRNIDIKIAQKNDFWVGSCRWTNERYLKSGICKDRIFLSYYGGDIMHEKYDNKDLIKKEYNLPQDAILIGMVAYMYPPKHFLGQKRGIKGHEDFIDAIKIVSNRYKNVYGLCIGGVWGDKLKYEEKLVRYAKNHTKNIIFMGTRSNVPELYPELYLVVHPSHSENLGGAGESLSLGIPTIATNIGGFPDIVKNGKTGISIPPKNPEYLAKEIIKCINGEYNLKQFSENGKELVSELLDVKNTAKSILEIYKKILKQNHV